MIEKELSSIFSEKDFELESETPKSIRLRLCKSFGIKEKQFPREQRDCFKGLLLRFVQQFKKEKEEEEEDVDNDNDSSEEEAEEDDSCEEGESSDDPDQQSKKRKRTNHRKKRPRESEKRRRGKKTPKASTTKTSPSSSSSVYGSNVKILIDLGRAMRIGPTLYHGLKEMSSEEDQIYILRERLHKAGASWKGKFPSKRDISKAKQKRQRLDDLDGLDTSLIIQTANNGTSRPQRSRRQQKHPVKYTFEQEDEEDEENEQDGGKDDDEDDQAELQFSENSIESSDDEHQRKSNYSPRKRSKRNDNVDHSRDDADGDVDIFDDENDGGNDDDKNEDDHDFEHGEDSDEEEEF